jgi:tetratricopeptide (TPR) repeat protein
MKTKQRQGAQRYDAFISHASKDAKFVAQLVKALHDDGLKAWIDHADVRYGALLRNALQSAIRKCRVLVLVWSEAASNSRWVMAEMFTALHSGRFIIPCVLDSTPLPQFLQNTAWLDRRRDKASLGKKLCAEIRRSPRGGNKFAPFMAAANREVDDVVISLARAQAAELEALLGDRAKAAKLHEAVDAALKVVEKAFPFQPMILSIAGYHRKNAYLGRHWDAIQAGQAPKDPLLEEAEHYFFKVLGFKPFDPSSLNGLGSVLLLERELDAAEFFVRRAIKLQGGHYPEAERDLGVILYYKARSEGPNV